MRNRCGRVIFIVTQHLDSNFSAFACFILFFLNCKGAAPNKLRSSPLFILQGVHFCARGREDIKRAAVEVGQK